jgi:pimeloyl-ACP methyl ester carboxylesterase
MNVSARSLFVLASLVLKTGVAVAAANACPNMLPTQTGAADVGTCLVADSPDAIGTRIPLILIHGINGNGTDLSTLNTNYFQSFRDNFSDRSSTFGGAFKIYSFYYVSNRYTVSQLGQSLRNWLDYFRRSDSDFDKQMVVVAHSMGGLVARSYMNEYLNEFGQFAGEYGGEAVMRLITLATPHLGTPMANSTNLRVHGGIYPEWRATLAGAVDSGMWLFEGWCRQCFLDISYPNRGDLRWAGLDGAIDPFADSPAVFANAQGERNTWLKSILPKVYDYKIIAYFGTIGSLGPNEIMANAAPGPLALGAGLTDLTNGFALLDPDSADSVLLTAGGVILERIYTDQLDTTVAIEEVHNDGVVPALSGAYEGGIVAKRIALHKQRPLSNGER